MGRRAGGWIVFLTLVYMALGHPRAEASLQVSPAILEGALRPGQRTGPIWVRNGGPETTRVEAELVGLTHDAAGRPRFLRDPEVVQALAGLVRPSWEQVSLAAGETRPLYLEVSPRAHGAPGAYGALLVKAAVPTGTLQVAVLLLLAGVRTGPDAAREGQAAGGSLPVVAAWVEQRKAGIPVELVAEVVNRGAVHRRPLLLARISGPDGSGLGEALLGPALVLPGARRQLRGVWSPALLVPGEYRVSLHHDGPGGHPAGPVGHLRFAVVAPYRVAVVEGSVSLALLGTGPDGQPALQALVRNTGSAPATPVLEVQVVSPAGAVGTSTVRVPEVAPGQQAAVLLPWPAPAGPGPHTARVRWVDQGRTVAESSIAVWTELAAAPEGPVAR